MLIDRDTHRWNSLSTRVRYSTPLASSRRRLERGASASMLELPTASTTADEEDVGGGGGGGLRRSIGDSKMVVNRHKDMDTVSLQNSTVRGCCLSG